jgi:hypothetical protein
VISREKLLETKRMVKRPDSGFNAGAQEVVHMLVDQCLIMHDQLTGGQAQRDWAAERANSDHQVRLALDDLRPVIEHSPKGTYILNCIDKMLKAKLGWARLWSQYQPMIEEEFGA